MLTSLQIKNFRALENFEVSKLGRVNLIVGKNNSGKSSVLEALRVYAGNANLKLLEEIAAGHDEKYRLQDSEFDEKDVLYPFEDFFTGRRFPAEDGCAIEIGDPIEQDSMLRIEHAYFRIIEESIEDADGERVTRRRHKVLKSELSELIGEELRPTLHVKKGERQTIHHFALPRRLRIPNDMPDSQPCSVIPTQFISIDELANEWDDVVLTPNQDIVHEALRIIASDFEAIAFVNNEGSRNEGLYKAKREFNRSAKVKLAGHNKSVPLNSMGDGMLRVLQLVLKVFPAKGGFLLIDEFENGLHYSVQEKVWSLVFELASKLDIQVFATTHSWDCIESFAKVANDRKDVEGVLFRVGRSVRTSDKGRVIATVFDEDQLFNITQADVEVR